MKSNAPWSVKGIERDARETAKEAAKRQGMTVGEWLNQMIYSAGDMQSSGGEVEGLKLRDIVTAIEQLHKRIADGAKETNASLGEVTRKVGDVVERVQRLERGAGEGALPPGLEDRIARLEKDGGDRERVDALKALEKAVAQVAVQFSNAQKTTFDRLNAAESQMKGLREKIETNAGVGDASAVGYLKDAIDGLQLRIARNEKAVQAAATGGGSKFVEDTENRLRVLGDEIKRSGDQIGSLQQTIGKLSQQIEAAERRSAEGVQKTADALAELRERFSGDALAGPSRDDIAALVADQSRTTIERVDRLQAALERVLDRLEAIPGGAVAAAEAKAEARAETAGADAESDDDDVNLFDDAPATGETAAAPEALGGADDNDDEDDDDFFSFADDIEASIDDEPESAAGDDFSFELDEIAPKDAGDRGGAEAAADGETPAAESSEGALLLSEVQAAFSGEGARKSQPAGDDDLDELLAGLEDDAEEDAPAASGADAAAQTAAEAAAEAADTDADAAKAADPASRGEAAPSAGAHDFLKSVRRQAQEGGALAGAEDLQKGRRRKLTPKQKAILAARMRRKKQLEGGETESAATLSRSEEDKRAARKALHGAEDESANGRAETEADLGDLADDALDDLRAEAKRAASRGRKFLFFGKRRNDEDEDDADEDAAASAVAETPDNEDEFDGDDRVALETLKTTASARPITLALGVGICLAVGLLFLMLKDNIFGARDAAPSAASDAGPNVARVENGELIDAPAPPAVDPVALYRDAMTGLNAAETAGETAAAIDKLERAALLGHPPAQLQLGELYKTGQGVDQDLAQARTWFRRAANGGNVLAMHRAGVMTARGDGGPADTAEAITFFEQAADRGLVDSQYNLGAIYHPSDADNGVQNAEKSYFWYSLAARNGDEQAGALAESVGAAIAPARRAEIDEEVAAWEPITPNAEANLLATAG